MEMGSLELKINNMTLVKIKVSLEIEVFSIVYSMINLNCNNSSNIVRFHSCLM